MDVGKYDGSDGRFVVKSGRMFAGTIFLSGGGGPNHWEICLRDPDGYTIVLASPVGTPDGSWKPEA